MIRNSTYLDKCVAKPLIRVEQDGSGRVYLVRGGGAVACTIDEPIIGFQGFRYRWWNREDEKPIDLSLPEKLALGLATKN